jgi:GNAT superfamily N-acetyltransferase
MKDRYPYIIRAVGDEDKAWIKGLIKSHWGDDSVVVHEEVFFPGQLPGFFAAEVDRDAVGLVTYQIRGEVCEIITLNSLVKNQGVGSCLVEAVVEEAVKSGCRRLCLTTTNDNQLAIEFYKKRGFKLREIRKGAVDKARALKPSIPEFSPTGVPICDEWEFELILLGTHQDPS